MSKQPNGEMDMPHISPAIGEYAITELAKAREDCERLRHALGCLMERIDGNDMLGDDDFMPTEFLELARKVLAETAPGAKGPA